MVNNYDLRTIGTYTGTKKGPLMIAIGGLHGNELAGVHALETLFRMLEEEPRRNPDFQFKGTFIGLRGNLRALRNGSRQMVKDLNRQFTTDNINRVLQFPESFLDEEDMELKELYLIIISLLRQYRPTKLVIIDLHTTSASGGIFSIVSDHPESLRIATALHVPVIKGLMNGLSGTTMHFFNKHNLGIDTIAMGFEAGQHEDPLSVSRSIAAVVNCMRAVGCVRRKDVESKHDIILKEYARGLPKVTEVLSAHHIAPGDAFAMAPGFINFQPVKAGQVLANDQHGAILAPEDCLILMPLYQKQGSEGFFLVREVG